MHVGGVTVKCLYIGSQWKTSTGKFIEALKFADIEEGYRGDEFVVNILGKRDVFLTRCPRQIHNSLI